MIRAILHLGYPKTGTTYFQRKIFPQAAEQFSVLTPEFENCGVNIKKTAQLVQSGVVPDDLRDKIMTRALLLSYESFLFDALRVYSNNHLTSVSFPQALNGLKSLCRDVPADAIDIVIYLRRQDDLIHSLYCESKTYHYGSVDLLNTLAKYADAVMAEWTTPDSIGYYYNFANTISDIREIFPRSKIHLRLYEDLAADSAREVDFWSQLTGVQFEYIPERENVRSMSGARKRADEPTLRSAVLRIKRRFFPGLKLPNSLSRKLRSILSLIRFGEAETIVMDEDVRRRLRSHFADINDRLAHSDDHAARALDGAYFERKV